MKRLTTSTSTLTLTLLLASCNMQTPVQNSFLPQADTAYYLDCNASTNGDGTQATPWNTLNSVNNKPGGFSAGDRILLKRGSTCTGQLAPKGSGQSGNPIVIDAYGSDGVARPVINGNGLLGGTVSLSNQDYWLVQNLEITNNSTTRAKRQGVYVTATDGRTHENIHVKNLYVHDVFGCNVSSCKVSGGIIFEALNTGSKFNDILIEKNEVTKSDWGGIQTNGVSYTDSTTYWTNVRIRENYLHDFTGDGIVMRTTVNGLIESNKAERIAQYHNGSAVAAIWTRSTKDSLVQFNEVRGSTNGIDGQAYDSDLEDDGAIYQYNYSHGNQGLMLTMYSSRNATIRYNISINDNGGGGVFRIGGTNTKIYNNTIIGSNSPFWEYKDTIRAAQTANNGLQIMNNLFYYTGNTNKAFVAYTGGIVPVFKNNLIYDNGYLTGVSLGDNQVFSDPLLVNANFSGKNEPSGFLNPSTLQNLDSLYLKPASPAIGSGTLIDDNGGRDYFGNPVSGTGRPNIGAVNASKNFSSFAASEDSYVQDGTYQANNYGSDLKLKVKDINSLGYVRRSFLRFQIPQSSFQKAILRVYGGNAQDTSNAQLNVNTAGDGWREAGVNFSNQPLIDSAPLNTARVNNIKKYWDVDVTPYVKSKLLSSAIVDQVVPISFALTQPTNANVLFEFNSRENIMKPELLLFQ